MTTYPSNDFEPRRYALWTTTTGHDRDGNRDLRSALARLPMAVVVVDDKRMLLPLNLCGERLFDEEALHPDLLESYRSHPLARLIRAIDCGGPEPSASQTVRFPSGERYQVKISTASKNRSGAWLLLLIQPAAEGAIDETAILDRWAFTPREREIAVYLLHGLSTDALRRSMGIALNTARTHIRRILEKSETHTRAAFIAKVLGCCRE